MATLTILKNTSTQAVAKVTGSGSVTIDISSLITNLSKTISTVAGLAAVQMDAYGLAVGSSVVSANAILPVGATITKISGNSVTFSAAALADGKEDVVLSTQTAVAPKVHINRATFATNSTITVSRGGVDILVLRNTDDWLFTDYAMTEQADQNISVNLGDNGTCILVLRKVSGYGNEQGWFGA